MRLSARVPIGSALRPRAVPRGCTPLDGPQLDPRVPQMDALSQCGEKVDYIRHEASRTMMNCLVWGVWSIT